jgi:hypothetical protein
VRFAYGSGLQTRPFGPLWPLGEPPQNPCGRRGIPPPLRLFAYHPRRREGKRSAILALRGGHPATDFLIPRALVVHPRLMGVFSALGVKRLVC